MKNCTASYAIFAKLYDGSCHSIKNIKSFEIMEENKNIGDNQQRKNNLVIIILSIALLASWAYILWNNNEQMQFKKEAQETISENSNQRDLLQLELADATRKYDELKTISARKDSTITARDREIIIKKDRIESLLGKVNASKGELIEAKNLIKSLNLDIEGFRKEIETLQGEKIKLSSEKAIVTEERDALSRNFDSARKVIEEKDDVIRLGSTLHASNFRIQAIAEKAGGREKTTGKAKRTDKLRIIFDLDENRILSSGTQDLFVSVVDPAGKPVIDMSAGSGQFTSSSGNNLWYTQKLEVNYVQNKRQTIQFDWRHGTDFKAGNYSIEVFHNGFSIGSGRIPLK
jgi:hypothetical protein